MSQLRPSHCDAGGEASASVMERRQSRVPATSAAARGLASWMKPRTACSCIPFLRGGPVEGQLSISGRKKIKHMHSASAGLRVGETRCMR